ncbi:MAG TPA: DUF3011 domain-containing protein [Thermoanaerobaculia bacterium]|nr:DUF3011 domain-containing protein [Thermoanaerobaculia bacterium]
MKKFCLAIAVIVLTVPAFAQDTRIRCESDGGRHQCGFTGTGSVALVRQLSKSNCEYKRSWGYSGDTIWVDRGCRADFVVSRTSAFSSIPTSAVVCESDGGMHRCATDTRYGVRLSRQSSKHACVEGKDWGYTSDGIWVDRGCRAEFIVGPGPMTSASPNYHGSVVCESHNNTRERCAADTRFGVSIARQLSENACILNESWGWNNRNIWVSKGCRAEFILGTQ